MLAGRECRINDNPVSFILFYTVCSFKVIDRSSFTCVCFKSSVKVVS